MNKFLWLLVAFLLPAMPATSDPAAALAAARSRYPATDVRAAMATPLPGIYEFDMGGETVYGDESARYLILGRLLDMATPAGAGFDYAAIAAAAVDLQGGTEAEVVLFSDPQCPYCAALERRLQAGELDGIRVRLVFAPILQGSTRLVRQFLCMDDPGKAYREFMLTGRHSSRECAEERLAGHVTAMRAVGITATPSFLAPSGAVREGLPGTPGLRDWIAAEQHRQ